VKARKTVVRETAWVDAIAIARAVRLHADGKRESTGWAARRLFRLALALLDENRVIVEWKP